MKLLLITAVLFYVCESHKILVVFPIPGKSHGILGAGVVKHLLNAGHEVTSILPFERKPHANLTQVLVDNSQHFNENSLNIKKIMDKELDMSNLDVIQHIMYGVSSNTIRQEVVKKLLRDPSKTFDLIISEWMFSELPATLAPLYQCPLAWVSTVEPHWQVMRLIDEPMNPAYSTNILGSQVPPYSFWYRVEELWLQLKGYRTTRQDIKKILDNAKNGLIYFSMGSNLKSKDIPEDLKKGILQVFSELKQTVLWKLEEVLPNLPKNVHIVSWAPQASILAHPNTVLFISHGGLLSTTEALYFGKPMIGIPVLADQFVNVERAVHKMFARKVELSYNMIEDFRREIKEVLENPKYTKKAQEWSLVYHDRPITPGQELIFWVDHVIKTKGALHLRSPALLLPWYQRMYLDLLAVVLAAFGILIYWVKSYICRVGKKQKLS